MGRVLILLVMNTLWILSISAQQPPGYQGSYTYQAYPSYGYAQPYQYQYPYQHQQQPAEVAPQQYYGMQPYGTGYVDPETLKDKPVEIWLDKQMGRWGDYWFPALGGSSKHPTPKGTFTVKSKYKDFYSRKYDAPMPRSVFFTEQCAIHVGSLRVKSHGCIHVDWQAGQLIFDNAKIGKTQIKVYR